MLPQLLVIPIKAEQLFPKIQFLSVPVNIPVLLLHENVPPLKRHSLEHCIRVLHSVPTVPQPVQIQLPIRTDPYPDRFR